MNHASLSRIILITSITFFYSSSMHANLISAQELETIAKEDIATAQALLEVCPALVNDMTHIKKNVEQFTQDNLTRFSVKTTLAQLQTDPEYVSALTEAKQEHLEFSPAEQQAGCAELNNSEM